MWLLIILFIVVSFWYYSHRRFQYFSSRGVKNLPPVPFFGNLARATFGVENFVDATKTAYDTFENERYFGMFKFLMPTVVVKDPQLIRDITVRDFAYFHDRALIIDPHVDQLMGRTIISCPGSKWKTTREAVTPAFSAAKCRGMIPLMEECAEKATNYLHEIIPDTGKLIDINDISYRYMNDVIASCVFGFAVDSFKEPDNEIIKLGYKVMVNNISQVMKFFGYELVPFLMKLLRIKVIPKKEAELFSNIFKMAVKRRQDESNSRQDFIQTIIKGSKELSELDMTAQAIQFYVAGFDTSSNLIGYVLYAMAANPDVQEKLFNEINALSNDSDSLSDKIQKLEYLDMCVSETLRLWPLAASPDRVVTTKYDFGPTHEGSSSRLIAEPGTNVWLPLYSLHRDEKYWPQPNEFIPERFSAENKANIKPFTYLPFGSGPRHCIGTRFALQAVKVFLYYFFKEYQTLNPQMSEKICPRAFILRPAGGYNMIVRKRI